MANTELTSPLNNPNYIAKAQEWAALLESKKGLELLEDGLVLDPDTAMGIDLCNFGSAAIIREYARRLEEADFKILDLKQRLHSYEMDEIWSGL